MDKITDMNSAAIRQNAGIKSNWEYREFMQKNGKQIMKVNTQEYFNASGNNPFYTSLNPNREIYTQNNQSSNQEQSTPFLFQSAFDTRTPSLDAGMSDLKRDYLKKERIAARMVAPTVWIDQKK